MSFQSLQLIAHHPTTFSSVACVKGDGGVVLKRGNWIFVFVMVLYGATTCKITSPKFCTGLIRNSVQKLSLMSKSAALLKWDTGVWKSRDREQ